MKKQTVVVVAIAVLAFALITLGFLANQGTDISQHAPEDAAPGLATDVAEIALAPPPGESPTRAPFVVEPGVDYLALGQAAFARRDYGSAVEHLQRAAIQDGERFQVHYLLGLALRLLGRAEESAQALDQALGLAPGDVRALVNGARTQLDLGRADEAEAMVAEAIRLAPGDGDAWNVLGRVQLVQGRLDDAGSSLRHACQLDPVNAYARNNLGLVHLLAGEWDAAAKSFLEAVALRGDVAVFHNNLGLAYEHLGRLDFATRAFARAVELDPEHARAQASLVRLAPLLGGAASELAAKPDSAEVPAPAP